MRFKNSFVKLSLLKIVLTYAPSWKFPQRIYVMIYCISLDTLDVIPTGFQSTWSYFNFKQCNSFQGHWIDWITASMLLNAEISFSESLKRIYDTENDRENSIVFLFISWYLFRFNSCSGDCFLDYNLNLNICQIKSALVKGKVVFKYNPSK